MVPKAAFSGLIAFPGREKHVALILGGDNALFDILTGNGRQLRNFGHRAGRQYLSRNLFSRRSGIVFWQVTCHRRRMATKQVTTKTETKKYRRHMPEFLQSMAVRNIMACSFLLAVYLTAGAARQTSADPPNRLFTVQIEDLSPKFLDFYDAAVRSSASPDARWKLWKEKYDYAAVPPIPAGQQIAHDQLDAAWPNYPATIQRIQRGAAALTPSPQERLGDVAMLLGADRPVRIRLIAFVGTFHRNAFASGLKDGVSTISIPLEDSDKDHALDMTHEFTHAVQMQMGAWSGQSVASQIFAEGLAMRVTERLNPGFPASVYATGSPEWMVQCETHLPEVLADLREHIAESGAEAVSQFTFGTGATGIHREVYCGGWFVVGKMLNDGATFPQLGRLHEDEANARVAATIDTLTREDSARRPPQ